MLRILFIITVITFCQVAGSTLTCEDRANACIEIFSKDIASIWNNSDVTTACSQSQTVIDAANTCLSNVNVSISDATCAYIVEGHLLAVQQNEAVIAPSCSGCDYTRMSVCLQTYATAIGILITKSSDNNQTCLELPVLYQQTINCLNELAGNCVGDQIYATNVQLFNDGYQVYSSQLCGSSSINDTTLLDCSAAEKMQTCNFNLSIALAELSNTFLNSLSDIPGFCNDVDVVSTDAKQCLNKSVLGTSDCDVLLQNNTLEVDLLISQFTELCGSNTDCSELTLTLCFQQFVWINGSTDSCSIYNESIMCYESWLNKCADMDHADIDFIFGPEFSQSLDNLKIFCSPGCADYEAKTLQFMQCLSYIPVNSLTTVNQVCGYLTASLTCMDNYIGECEYLKETISQEINLLPEISMFGCDISIGSTTYIPECNMPAVMICNNPLLAAVGLPQFTLDTDLIAFSQQSSTSDLENSLFEKNTETCSEVRNNVNIEQTIQCTNQGILNCPLDLFRQPNQNYTNSMNVSDILPTDTFKALEEVRLNMFYLFSAIDDGGYEIQLLCSSGCENITNRALGVALCVLPISQTPLSDIQSMVDFVTLTVTTILSKYNSQQEYTSDCSTLQSLQDCASKYLMGCSKTESLASQSMQSIVSYSVVDICNINLQIPVTQQPAACTEREYWLKEMDYITKVCGHPTYMNKDYTITQTNLCSSLQSEINCYVRNTYCCEVRKKLVEPMFHTWGMFNQLYGCNLVLEGSNADTQKLSIKPLESSCSYNQVLDCYSPLLTKIGLNTSMLSDANLQKMLQLKQVVMNDTANMCVSNSDWAMMEMCISNVKDQCRYPSTCSSIGTDVSHPNITDLPLSKFMDLVSIQSLCSQDCVNIQLTEEDFSACDVETVIAIANKIRWDQIVGESTQEYCRELEEISSCIMTKIGTCDFYTRMLHTKIDLRSGSSASDASKSCNVNFGTIQMFPTNPAITTTSSPSTTENSQITGAGSISISIYLLCVTSINVWLIL